MKEKHPVDVHIAKKMRKRRAMLGMTQADLADRVNISPQQIQKYESADSKMAASMLHDVASALGVKAGYFIDD